MRNIRLPLSPWNAMESLATPRSDSALARKMLWYSAAAAGVTGLTATDADAQIVYTDFPDVAIQNLRFPIDFDTDGDPEFFIDEHATRAQTTLRIEAVAGAGGVVDSLDGIIGEGVPYGTGTYAYPSQLNTGVEIGPANPTLINLIDFTIPRQATFTFQGSDPLNWINAGPAFIGVRFKLDGVTHYGWLRVEMAASGQITLFDYAYETSADTPLNAGEGVANENGPLPAGYEVSQARPNPAIGSAQFTLRVAETQNVRVEVMNTLGQQVAVIHDGPLSADAAHTLRFDGVGLPAGAYVVRITGEQFAQTRRLTLLR